MESDKEKDGQEANPQALEVEDLPIDEAEQDDVKGGTWYLRNENSSG